MLKKLSHIAHKIFLTVEIKEKAPTDQSQQRSAREAQGRIKDALSQIVGLMILMGCSVAL
jgi:hypothetical protein